MYNQHLHRLEAHIVEFLEHAKQWFSPLDDLTKEAPSSWLLLPLRAMKTIIKMLSHRLTNSKNKW
jgi:hypothetical protein